MRGRAARVRVYHLIQISAAAATIGSTKMSKGYFAAAVCYSLYLSCRYDYADTTAEMTAPCIHHSSVFPFEIFVHFCHDFLLITVASSSCR